MPLPRVMKPTIGSGGAGLQQLAMCVSRPEVPSTSTPDLPPFVTLDARLPSFSASGVDFRGLEVHGKTQNNQFSFLSLKKKNSYSFCDNLRYLREKSFYYHFKYKTVLVVKVEFVFI